MPITKYLVKFLSDLFFLFVIKNFFEQKKIWDNTKIPYVMISNWFVNANQRYFIILFIETGLYKVFFFQYHHLYGSRSDRIKVGNQLMPGWKGWLAGSGEGAMWAEVFQIISPLLHLQGKKKKTSCIKILYDLWLWSNLVVRASLPMPKILFWGAAGDTVLNQVQFFLNAPLK